MRFASFSQAAGEGNHPGGRLPEGFRFERDAANERAERFIDTNVLLYLLSADEAMANQAEALVAAGGVISVQVLSEFAAVGSRKLGMPLADIREVLDTIRAICTVVAVDTATHDAAMRVAERYGLSIYDALIVASALGAGCRILLTEDLQHGSTIDKRLRIVNPFA